MASLLGSLKGCFLYRKLYYKKQLRTSPLEWRIWHCWMVNAVSLTGLLKGVVVLNCFILFTYIEPTSHVPFEILILLSDHVLEFFLSFYFIMRILPESKIEIITNIKWRWLQMFCKIYLSPRWYTGRWHDAYRCLCVRSTRRPRDHASICSGKWNFTYLFQLISIWIGVICF